MSSYIIKGGNKIEGTVNISGSKNSSLPIMADASHGTGIREYVIPVNTAAVLMGADIIEVEVHIEPNRTIKPGDFYQMLNIQQYKNLISELNKINNLKNKRFDFM